MGNFLGPLNDGAYGAQSQDGTLGDLTNDSTTTSQDYRVSTGFEHFADPNTRQEVLSQGTEGDTGQQPISQTKGWDSDITSNVVDENYKNTPTVGGEYSSGPDEQGQLLRGYVLNGPDVTANVQSEGVAVQKGSMYVPRVTVLHDPNPTKAR